MHYRVTTYDGVKTTHRDVEDLFHAFFDMWDELGKLSEQAHLMLHVKVCDGDKRGFWLRRHRVLNEIMQPFCKASLYWRSDLVFDHKEAKAAGDPEASAFVVRMAGDRLKWQLIPEDGSWDHLYVQVEPVAGV